MASTALPLVHELQNRVRELEALRKSRGDEAARIIASQRATIDRLRADNQRLAADLASVGSADAAAVAALVATGAATSAAMVKSMLCPLLHPLPASASAGLQPSGLTQAQSDRCDKLMELADTYSRKIEVEQRQLEGLEREVELAQAQILAARRDVGGHSGTQALLVAPSKARRALETRCDAAQRRFNEHIAANRDLKQQIDAATRRQAGMEQVRAQLERAVAGVAAELVGVQEAARVAAEARQEAAAQVAALKVAEDAETAAFEAEVRELAACTAADERLLQAQAVRLTKVVEAAEAAEAQAGPDGASPRSGGGGGASPGSPVPLDLDSVEQGVGAEAAAMQLQRAAGLPSLPATLAHYSCLEQRSFDLFAACNEASERITALTQEARQLEAECRALESAAVSGRQHEAIRGVLGRRDAALRRGDSCAERRGQLERKLAQLRTGIYSCLRKLGATAAAQAWEAAAPQSGTSGTPATASGGTSADGASASAGAGNGAAAAAAAAPAAHSTASAACAHIMAGLALLEQRAAAVIAVQGTMVGRTSSLARGSAPTVGRLPSAGSSPAGGARVGGGKAAGAGAGGSAGGRGVEMIEDSEDDGEDEVPLTREQIQARSSSLRRT